LPGLGRKGGRPVHGEFADAGKIAQPVGGVRQKFGVLHRGKPEEHRFGAAEKKNNKQKKRWVKSR